MPGGISLIAILYYLAPRRHRPPSVGGQSEFLSDLRSSLAQSGNEPHDQVREGQPNRGPGEILQLPWNREPVHHHSRGLSAAVLQSLSKLLQAGPTGRGVCC
jgi:hypothetical protein